MKPAPLPCVLPPARTQAPAGVAAAMLIPELCRLPDPQEPPTRAQDCRTQHNSKQAYQNPSQYTGYLWNPEKWKGMMPACIISITAGADDSSISL